MSEKNKNLGLAEELWDENSEYIDDNSDSFQRVAGTSLMKRADFIKVVTDLLDACDSDLESAKKARP